LAGVFAIGAAKENEAVDLPRSVLAVDADEVALQMVKNHFQGAEVFTTSNALEAWQHLQATSYEMIIIDWELPDIPGVMLFNRIRGLPQFALTPLLLLSTASYPKEFKLFQEYPLSTLAEKPLTKQKFERRVADLLREQQHMKQNEATMDQLVKQLESAAAGKAIKAVVDLLNKSPNPAPLGFTAGRKLIEAERYAEAEKIYRTLISHDQYSLLAMSGLAKVLLLQEKLDEAADVLRVAQKASPKNLDRLHLLGEIDLKKRDSASAQKWFQDALSLDPDSEKAKLGLTVAKNIDGFLRGSPESDVPKNFAGLLNMIGIGLVRNGKFNEGIDQYRAAMEFVRGKDEQAKLAFNAGLGFLRAKDKKQALNWFRKSVECGSLNFNKSAQYVKQLDGIADVDGQLEEPEKI
jgi:CheY-like chemotaxis protein